ncbi:hypothetical protein CFC21_112480 [Triticum aestivum]|uniref:Uncharacterized protein n=3 Tax=Triticum TaxID=4564 RepID=A0A9R0G4V3_WHEAT|nr:hypothetical protein CFC21_034000 [Triticum aestivum]MBC2899660.1 hypothetical protein [Triticum aestivum]VAH41090.1 unnamed protein product [Triticum turgidum subsp. durum]
MAAYMRSQLVLLRSPGQRHLLSYRSSSSSSEPRTATPPHAPAVSDAAGGRTSTKSSIKHWIYGRPGLASMLSLLGLFTTSSPDAPTSTGGAVSITDTAGNQGTYEPPQKKRTT